VLETKSNIPRSIDGSGHGLYAHVIHERFLPGIHESLCQRNGDWFNMENGAKPSASSLTSPR